MKENFVTQLNYIPKLSIVATLYKSSPYIYEFYERVCKVVDTITSDYEIIFVDDGSPDDSLLKAIELYEQDFQVKVVELSRNFGHHKAIMTGLAQAQGDYVFLIDIDLEEEPELLGKFWKEMQNDKSLDMVYGVQKSRKGWWFERWSGAIFYKLFNFLTQINLSKNIFMARLMTRKFCHSLIQFQDKNPFLAGLIELNGFHKKAISCEKHSKGTTTYSLRLKFAMVVESITSFSSKPLYYIFYFGLFVTLLSVLYGFKLIVNKMLYAQVIDGYTSIMVSIFFFGGIIIFFLGIIGIYLSKIFLEVKDRPIAVIKNIYKKKVVS